MRDREHSTEPPGVREPDDAIGQSDPLNEGRNTESDLTLGQQFSSMQIPSDGDVSFGSQETFRGPQASVNSKGASLDDAVAELGFADDSADVTLGQNLRSFADLLGDGACDLNQTLASCSLRSGVVSSNSDTAASAPIHVRSLGFSLAPESQTDDQPDFWLMEQIGRGGMGTVHLARQVSVGRDVAVKQLHGRLRQLPDAYEEFLNEAVVTGALEHPNIVPIYEVGRTEDGDLFYAMKHIRGESWSKLIDSLSLDENLDILLRVCDAIAFAHSRGVIHRDLKPENVMTGEFGEVLVMDWGLAVSMGPDGLVYANSGGTPSYMSPEMVNSPHLLSPASDTYLLGGLLFRLLTGKAPHKGKHATECLRAAASNEIRTPPTDRICDLDPSGELLGIALRAMETRYQDRYQTVAEFQADVRNFLSHRQSVGLAHLAQADWESAEQSQDYTDYSRALFGFEEAEKLWRGNSHASSGIREVKRNWALCAERKGDFDLALSLIEKVPEYQDVTQRLTTARDERNARKSRIKMLRHLLSGTILVIFLVVGAATWWINSARLRARANASLAMAHSSEATRQRESAVVAKALAERRETEARVALDLAERRAVEARDAKELAEQHEGEAREAEKLAEANAALASDYRAQTMKMLNTMVFDILRKLPETPEANRIRRQVLTTVVKQLQLIGEKFEDTQRQTVVALIDLGDVVRRIGTPDSEAIGESFGDTKATELKSATAVAEELYKRAYVIAQKRVATFPTEYVARRDLAIAALKLGTVFEVRRNLDGAGEKYHEATLINEELVNENPKNISNRWHLANSLISEGQVAKQIKRFEFAKRDLLRALEILELVAKDAPNTAVGLSNISKSYLALAELHRESGDSTAAITYFRKSEAAAQRLMVLDPKEPTNQVRLSTVRSNLASLLTSQNRITEARQSLEQAIKAQQAVVDSDPQNYSAVHALSNSFERLGLVYQELGELGEARRLFNEMLKLKLRLESVDADRPISKREVAVTYLHLGQVDVLESNHVKGISKLGKAASIFEELLASDPSNIRAQRDASSVQFQLGNAYSAFGRSSDALEHFTRMRELAQRQLIHDPDSKENRLHLALAYSYICNSNLNLKRLLSAIDAKRNVVRIYQSIADDDPSLVNCRWLFQGIYSLGDLHRDHGDFEAASIRFAQALKLAHRLSKTSGRAAIDERNLATAYEHLGLCYLSQAMRVEARESFDEVVKLREKLVEASELGNPIKLDLAIAYDNLGVAYLWDDSALALELHKKSMAIRTAQLQSDPSNVALKTLVAKSHQRLGTAQLNGFKYSDAIAAFQVGLKLLDEVRESTGNARESQDSYFQLSKSLLTAQTALESVGDWDAMLKNRQRLGALLTVRMIEFTKQKRFSELPQISDEFLKLPTQHAVYFYNAALGYSLAVKAIESKKRDKPLSSAQRERRDELLALALKNVREAKRRGWRDFQHLQTDKDQAALQRLVEFQRLLGPVAPPLPSPNLRSRAIIR